MPRETIPADDNDPFVVSVGWQRDQDVQLGVQVADSDRTIVDLLFGGEGGYLGAIGQSLIQQIEGADWRLVDVAVENGRQARTSELGKPDGTGDVTLGQMVLNAQRHAREAVERDGLWASMSRRQINGLIQVLRRARDQAYGRDE